MTQGGIVDREGLDHLLTRCGSPIGHFLEVLELTYTESFGTTEREDRYSYTGSFPTRLGTTESAVVLIDDLRFVHTPYLAVLTPFGVHHSAGLEVIDEVFVFHYILALDLDVSAPERELGVGHNHFLRSVPVAECVAVTDDSDSLSRQDLRQVDRETDVTLRRFRFRGFMAHKEGLEESGGIETILVRAGLPSIAHYDTFVRSLERQMTRLTGLVDVLAFAYANGIFILHRGGKIADRYVCLPEIRSLAAQYKRRFLGPTQNRLLRLDHAKRLPILGTIVNLKIDVHDIVFY